MFWRKQREEKKRLIAPMYAHPERTSYASELQFEELWAVEDAKGPMLQPYEGLCELWDGYASYWLADYPDYLRSLSVRRRFHLGSVLDMACGTGLLTERLAEVADEVVGIDSSEPMLAKARIRGSKLKNVTFTKGDIRDFHIGRQFDAVVCSSNSMNYLEVPNELTAALRCVAEHLRPDGVFLFDTLTDMTMKLVSGQYLHAISDVGRFAMRLQFDPRLRRDETTVIMPCGIEVHQQFAIGPFEVEAAAWDAGLFVVDHFSSSCVSSSWNPDGICYFVLAKR